MVSKLTLEYDGADFVGWARQPGLRSVQEEVERALQTFLPSAVALTVGGRTDRGVHAWGQVASYPHEAVDPARLNAVLPADVAVLACEPRPEGFDARGDALSRRYCYRVLNRRSRSAFEHGHALWISRELDRAALHACAAALVGTHDFTAFTPSETDHVRFDRHVLDARWVDGGELLEFWIEADTFMRHMNRVLVGTMLEVASGQRASSVHRPARRPAALARPGRRRRPTACTWRRSIIPTGRLPDRMALPMPELPGVTHRDVTVGGVRLHVAEAGEGPPIVLQHGWPQHWWAWRRLIGPLAAEHRVICPDLRGFGWSDAPPGRYDKESLAGDLIGVLDALDLSPSGSSSSATTGAASPASWPACARRSASRSFLALSITHPWFSVGPGIPDPRALLRLWYQFVLASPFGPALLTRDGAMLRVFASAGEGVFDEETIALYVGALGQPATARASQALYRTFLTSEVAPIMRGRYGGERLTVPTRLVIGERDPVLTRDSVRGWEGHADELSVHWVPDSNHWLPEQRPERVLAGARASCPDQPRVRVALRLGPPRPGVLRVVSAPAWPPAAA